MHARKVEKRFNWSRSVGALLYHFLNQINESYAYSYWVCHNFSDIARSTHFFNYCVKEEVSGSHQSWLNLKKKTHSVAIREDSLKMNLNVFNIWKSHESSWVHLLINHWGDTATWWKNCYRRELQTNRADLVWPLLNDNFEEQTCLCVTSIMNQLLFAKLG